MSQVGKHTITLGDTLEPLKAILRNGDGNPYNLAAYTVKFVMETDTGTSEIAETATGVTAHPTQTFTTDTTYDTLKCDRHGVKEGDQVVVSSTTTLPTGLSASTLYFAVEVTPNAFKVALFPGGPAIDITGAGSGTHSFYIVGSVQYDFSSGNVDTAGLYRAWFTLTSSTETKCLPEGDRYIRVEIVNKGN